MELIKVKCKCGATLQISPEMAGRLGTCSKCGRTMRIPSNIPAPSKPGVPVEKQKTDVDLKLVVEDNPPDEDEIVYRLEAIEWPMLYARARGLVITALAIVVAVTVLYFVLPSGKQGDGGGKDVVLVEYLDADTGLHFVLPEGWQAVVEGRNWKASNKRLGAEISITAGAPDSLNELRNSMIAHAMRMNPDIEAELKKKISQRTHQVIRDYFTLSFSYREPSSNKEMYVLLHAFSNKRSSYMFEVKSGLNEWNSVEEEFDEAWNMMEYDRDSISPSRQKG